MNLRASLLILLLAISNSAHGEMALPVSLTALFLYLLFFVFALVAPIAAMATVLSNSQSMMFRSFVCLCTGFTYFFFFSYFVKFIKIEGETFLATIMLLSCILLVSAAASIQKSPRKKEAENAKPIDDRKWSQMAALLKNMGHSEADVEAQLVERGLGATDAREIAKHVYAKS